jgi:CheY-like chemotaxis protein
MHIQIGEGIRSVLIVEDEMIVAMLIEDLMRELGVVDVHICPDAASALQIVETCAIDCAILDLRIRDGSSTPVADALAEKAIPFVFSSGSDAGALEERYADRPMISKPFLDDDLKLIVLDTWTLARSNRAAEHVGNVDGQQIFMSAGK